MFHEERLTALNLTSRLLRGSAQHLVEDVERPLVFGLPCGSGLFKEVWIPTVKDLHNKNLKLIVVI